MELILAALRDKIPCLRIQPSHGTGGWWLEEYEDFNDVSESDCLLDDFIRESDQSRVEPLEILARGLLDDW